MQRATLSLAALVLGVAVAGAAEFKVEDIPAVANLDVAKMKPNTIYFSDYRKDELADPGTGFIKFEEWTRGRPAQKQLLSLYPTYIEPTVNVTANGVTKPKLVGLYMYVAGARFLLGKAPGTIQLNRYTTLPFIEGLDPMIKHKAITPNDSIPGKDPEYTYLRHPQRVWCEDKSRTICIESHYMFEGKFPLAIRLANKLREGKKKITEYLDFQSELRLLQLSEVDQATVAKLTGINTPVTGALEQSIFYINQVMQFGKMFAVLQQHPSDPSKTVATAFIALAIEADILEKKKEYENVPVLRNLVPAQVLVGASSFNTGNSISSGLPNYTRNQFKAIAGIMDKP